MPSTPVKLQMRSDTRRIELQQGAAATLAELLEHIGAHIQHTSLAAYWHTTRAQHSAAPDAAPDVLCVDGAFGDSGAEQLRLSYIDSEGDKCVIGWDEELVEAQRDAEEDGRLLKINVEAAPAAVQGIRTVNFSGESKPPSKAGALGLYAAAVVVGLCVAPVLAALAGWVAGGRWGQLQQMAKSLDLLLPPAAVQVAPAATADAPAPARSPAPPPPVPVPAPPPPVLPPPPPPPLPSPPPPVPPPVVRTPVAEPDAPPPPIRRVYTPLADAVAKKSAELHEVQLPRLDKRPYSDETDGVAVTEAAAETVPVGPESGSEAETESGSASVVDGVEVTEAAAEAVLVADLLILDAEAGKAQQQIAEAIATHVIQVQRSRESTRNLSLRVIY